METGGLWGAVLAGGPGSRLGGGKPFKEIAGRRLIDLALKSLGRVCPQLMIVTNDVAAYAEHPCLVLADRWPGRGPLAALATAFLDSPAQGVLLMAVDMPLVRPELLAALALAHGREKALAPLGPRWPEPLLAYYSRDCLPAIMRLLEQGDRRPRMLLKAVGAELMPREEVLAHDPEGLSFMNVNFPEDLEQAEREGRLRGLFDTA
jgi:molybdopterin-guanine dinucleotide biosynthesis protein A